MARPAVPGGAFLWGRQVKVTGRGDFTLTGRLKSVIVERLDPVDPDDARAIDLAMKYTKQAAQSGRLAGSQP